MATRDAYAPGTFCYADLATTEPHAALDFYGDLFGWTARELPGPYWALDLEGLQAAGLSILLDRLRASGVPPHWASYVAVGDVDAITAHAEQLGAQVVAEPFGIGEAARMSAIADPQGANLMLWEGRTFPGAGVVNAPGALSWNDLHTPAPEEAAGFYRGLFGWRIEEAPGSHGQYLLISNGERTNGGILESHDEGGPPFWTPYFGAADLDATIVRAQDEGGRLVFGPIAVPQGRFALLADPQGAAFSLVESEFDD
jgi:predicted enzyme related to lactoylglutathione lyase